MKLLQLNMYYLYNTRICFEHSFFGTIHIGVLFVFQSPACKVQCAQTCKQLIFAYQIIISFINNGNLYEIYKTAKKLFKNSNQNMFYRNLNFGESFIKFKFAGNAIFNSFTHVLTNELNMSNKFYFQMFQCKPSFYQ